MALQTSVSHFLQHSIHVEMSPVVPTATAPSRKVGTESGTRHVGATTTTKATIAAVGKRTTKYRLHQMRLKIRHMVL